VEKNKNVVITTNRPKLYERLEAIQRSLVLCEKALAEYLETKRLAFPRFYFVSSVDLLDILSSGNDATAVSGGGGGNRNEGGGHVCLTACKNRIVTTFKHLPHKYCLLMKLNN